MKRFVNLVVVLALIFGLGLSMDAFGDLELPDPGVDVGEYVTLAITALGTTVALVVGGFMGFLVIRKGMKWAGSFAR